MARSLNRAQLIGNLTRDPELKYTPTGTAVCSFGIATNRNWTTDTGEKKDEVDFHRIVAWSKLAEICSQFLTKGRKVYVEGRLSTRNWTAQDGSSRSTTEIIINDMIVLDSNRKSDVEEVGQIAELPKEETNSKAKKQANPQAEHKEEETVDEVMPDDIPF